MSAKTKIIVLRAKELILGGALAVLGFFLLLFMILWLMPSKAKNEASGDAGAPAPTYRPGIYTAELRLGNQTIEVETILEADRISSIRLLNLDEVITTAYPLLEPTMESVCRQVLENQSTDSVKSESSARYTSLALLSAIQSCIDKGLIP